MSDFESQGSFMYEPSVSEKEVAQRLRDLSDLMTPDKCRNIERRFSFELTNRFKNKELYRSIQEISAALRHEVGNEVTVKFQLNPRWKAVQPSHLELSLPGTGEVKAHADYDSDSGLFDAYLKDADGTVLPRDTISVETAENLLTSLGIPGTIDDFTQKGLHRWLQTGIGNETHQHILQRHVIYESESDDEIAGTCEIEKEQIISPEEVTTYIRFIETILTDDKRFARVLTLFESDRGSGLSVEEITQSEDGTDTKPTQRQLDYELIEKLLQHLRNAELIATK